MTENEHTTTKTKTLPLQNKLYDLMSMKNEIIHIYKQKNGLPYGHTDLVQCTYAGDNNAPMKTEQAFIT